ncbi:stage II sporulation protein M [Desulfotomaculum nigrificans]|nr:stage II sporulation protein M [Desulfotomaculum nigrificans]
MRRNLKKIWWSSLRKGWPMYLVALVVLLAGLGCGSWGAHNLDQEQATRLTEYLDVFVSQVGSVQIDRPMLVKNTITNNIFFISIIYVLGLTVIGTPGILALLFARGFSLGFTLSFLTQGKTGQGILLALASVVPQSILLIPAVFMAGVAALSFSWLLIRRFLDSSLPVWPGIVSYHSLMLVVCCIAAAAGLVEAYITPELIKATISLLN